MPKQTCNTQIHALGNPKYKLSWPLLVFMEEYDDEVVASIPEFGLYGSAVSRDLALMKLKDEIVSTYERLTELASGSLGRLGLQHLEAMRAVIRIV